MTKRLQRFDFQNSPYERPSDRWICGNAAFGRACRLGPSGFGRCRAKHECNPVRSGDAWICTRYGSMGGPCGEGPCPDGSCSRKAVPCVPIPSLRRRRGKLTFWVAAATLGALALVFGTGQGIDVINPGAVIQGHAEAGDCVNCHVAFDGRSEHWILAAFRSTDPVADSKKCLACHEKGHDALSPHSLPRVRLAEHTKRVEEQSGSAKLPLLMSISEKLFERPNEKTSALACATCHKDHKGRAFDPTFVSNQRCQSCHKVKFASFADGHPAFGDYPYMRRSRLAFDHHKHFRKNFSEAKTDKVPESCATCHLPDSSGRFMLVQTFEQTCVTCHRKDIEGETVAGPKGIAVFSVPGLDTETLAERDFVIGEWPDLALANDVTPFMRLLLAVEPQIAADLERTAKLDLQDLTRSTDGELAAVRRIAWAIKELLYDFTISGADTIQTRLEGQPELQMDRVSLGRLLGHIPLDVVRAARRSWFPRLKGEVLRYRKTKAALYDGGMGPEPGPWRPGSAGAVQIALATAQGDSILDVIQPALLGAVLNNELDPSARGSERGADDPILLAQAGGDLLSVDGDLLDKDSLRIEDLDELLKEDSAADNSIFKAKRSSAGQGEQTAPQQKETMKQEADQTAADEADASAPADPPPPPAKPKSAPYVAAADEAQGKPAAEPVGEAGEEARGDTDHEEPLDPNLDPEVWARLGGWYRQDDALFYRPVEHRDAFLRTWFDISAALHGSEAETYGARILELFMAKDTPGKCTKCHSVDQLDNGRLKVNWNPFSPNPRWQDFSVFDHTAHFSLVEKKGCSTCHEIDARAKFPDGYKDFDAQSFAPNFAPMDLKVCASCHVEESAGDACVMCHRYHVGEFPITPVRTLIASLPVAATTAAREQKADRGGRSGPKSGSPRDQDRPSVAVELENLDTLHPADIVLQLSSLRSLDAATREWVRLKYKFAKLLVGKNLIVQRINLEKQGIFYRVLAHPFPDLDTARDLCNRLRTWEQDCLILHNDPSSGEELGATGTFAKDP